MGVTKVTLRKRLLPSGKITLYLDFYPPLRDPHSRKYVRHEYLGIYLVNKPRFQSDKDANKEKIAQAEAIRSERELAIIRGQYDFLDKTKLKMVFLAYFKTKLDTKDQKWIRVYDHFSNYCGGVCKMGDITVPFCEGFRHTFATLQVNEGTDIYTVSHLLTHANVGTTQIYADIVDKSKLDAVERIKIKSDK